MKAARQLLPLLPVPGEGPRFGAHGHISAKALTFLNLLLEALREADSPAATGGVTVPRAEPPPKPLLGRARHSPVAWSQWFSLRGPQARCQGPSSPQGLSSVWAAYCQEE